MKTYPVLLLSLVLMVAGSAQSFGATAAFTSASSSNAAHEPVILSQASGEVPAKTAVDAATPAAIPAVNPMDEEYKEDEDIAGPSDQTVSEERVEIADPLEPFNRAMHQFNDKLYFWALKPVAQGYNVIVPQPARVSVKNFFSNLAFPARFLSCLLQTDFSGAATEAGRFTINTVWGIGGLLDPSSGPELNLQKQDTDLGQTLGVWGVGQGFYIVWPVLGPSSPRDSVTIAGDYFLYPVSYISPWYASLGVRAYEEVNATSLRIGDYEALKNAAIDPYIAFRDAYIQYRYKKVKARKAKVTHTAPAAEEPAPAGPELPEKENK